MLAKGIGILVMMFHHCFRIPELYKGFPIVFSPLNEATVVNIGAFGKLCVGIFVILSAYGMTISLRQIDKNYELTRQQTGLFLYKRWFNLMSGWIFVFLVCQIVCAYLDGRPAKIYGKNGTLAAVVQFVIDGLGLANLFHTSSLITTWWYMSLAIVIIIAMPLLVKLYRQFGLILSLFFPVLFVRIFDISYREFAYWFFAVMLGIIAADRDWFVKMRQKQFVACRWLNKLLKLVVSVVLLYLGYKMRVGRQLKYMIEVYEALMPFLVIYMGFEFFSDIPLLNTFLKFAGKHSMNMFLIHTFIRHTYFHDVVYSFRYPIVIVAVLFGISLAVSIVIERVKQYSGYNRFTGWLREKGVVALEQIET